jgi:transposase
MSYYNGKRNKEKTRKQRLVLKWGKKLKAIQYKGNQCSECGEQRPWLLEFHHNDDNKENGVHELMTLSWNRIKIEVKKCTLLCRNCHGNIHFSSAYNEFEQEIKQKSKEIQGNYSNCVDHKKVISMNKKGLTQSKIAKELNCGTSTVCEILKSNGIHTEKKRKIIDPHEVKKLRDQGLTNPEIAKKLNIHRFTVPQILKRLREEKN